MSKIFPCIPIQLDVDTTTELAQSTLDTSSPSFDISDNEKYFMHVFANRLCVILNETPHPTAMLVALENIILLKRSVLLGIRSALLEHDFSDLGMGIIQPCEIEEIVERSTDEEIVPELRILQIQFSVCIALKKQIQQRSFRSLLGTIGKNIQGFFRSFSTR